MVGFPNPAQVGSSTLSKRQNERIYQRDRHGPQPLRVAAAAAAANANANGIAPPAPLDNAIHVVDGTTWFHRNILHGRNANSSHTAGPSGARRGLDLPEDEVSPPDLGDLDRVYTPGPGHILKYANTLTMTFEERMGTAEVQDLLQIMENRTVVDLYCKDIQAVAAAKLNGIGIDVDTIMDSVNATLVAFGEQFNDLPWGDICDILLSSTLMPDLPGPGQLARLTDEANFQDDLLRNAVAYCGGYSDSADARPSPRNLQSLTHAERTRWLDQFQAVITRMQQDARRAGAGPSASKSAIQATSLTKEEVDARLAAKMAAIELARKVPSAGTIQGLGAHLDPNAGPSMPVSETTGKQVGAVPMYGDDIVDSLAALLKSGPKAESPSTVRADLRTRKLVTPIKSSASAGPSTRPVSADIPLMYDPGKHGMPAGPSSDEDEPSSPAQSAKRKKKNRKKKKKSGAHSPPRSPVTLANRPSTPHPRKSEIGHEEALSSPSSKPMIEAVKIEPLAPASPSDSPLPQPPSDMQHPLPPRPSFASFDPAAAPSHSDSLGFAQAVMDSIISGSDSPEVVHAKSKAAERTSSVGEPVTFSVPPPPLESPPPLDAAEEKCAKQKLPSRTENKLEEQHDIEDIRLRVLHSMTSGLNIEDRNAVTRGVLAEKLSVVKIKPKADTHVTPTPVKHDRITAGDNDTPTPLPPSAPLVVSRVDLKARYIRYHAKAPWIDMPELSSDFEEYTDSPFDKAFGDALSNNVSKVHVEARLCAPLEKQSTKGIHASNNVPASREKPTIYQKPETNEEPGSNQKSELELSSPSEGDGRMKMMARPRITTSRESRRARAYSPTNSDPDNNPFTDVGDATFETTQIYTPFTPDDEALFASPAWTDVPRDLMTPLSPSRGPAANGSNPALLASAAINATGPIHQPQSAPESPTARLAATSTRVARLGEVLEPALTGDVPETEAADLAASTEEHVGPAVYVPYEELFIDRSGNIMDRKAAKSRVVQSPSTSADPFLVVDHYSHGNTDEETLSPDSFVNVSPAAGAVAVERPIASSSYVLIPPPDAGIKSNASGSQRPVFVPRPLAPVLEEEEWEDDEEEDPFRPTAPTTGGKMRFSPYTPFYSGPVDTPGAGPSGSKITSATGGRVLLDEFPISSVRSTADWDPELADRLAVVVYSKSKAGDSRKDKGKGKGKQSAYYTDDWQVPSPSAEDLLYSSPIPVFWPLKPAGRYGRVTPNIIATVCQNLLEDRCYRDCECLARACRGLGIDTEWTEMVIRINEPLLDSVTLPSIKTAYQGRPESILKRHDELFRRSAQLRQITARCRQSRYAIFDGLVRHNIRGTVNKPSQPLFPNVVGLAVKSSVFTMVRDNLRLHKDKRLPGDSVNLLVGIVATAFPAPHILCISPPPFPVCKEGDTSEEEDKARGGVGRFIRRLMVESNSVIIIYHDLKAGDFCPFTPHCVIELGKSPALDSCTRIGSRSRRISQVAKDKAALDQREAHYTDWQWTFAVLLYAIEKLEGDNYVTFRYTDRIFPAKSDGAKEDFSRDFVDRMVLCRFSPADKSKTKKRIRLFGNQTAAETEAFYQKQIRECIKEEGREEEYKTLLAKARKVVDIDNSGQLSPCPCCFKSGE